MANAKSTKTSQTSKVDEEYTKKLEERLEALEKFIALNLNQNNNIKSSDSDVIITSLTVGMLNLSTDGNGQGDIYTFNSFGEEQAIPYDDVKKIIKNNKSFLENGYFFINDDEMIENQKLKNIYKKIFSAEDLMKLFKEKKSSFKKIFSNMAQGQKEIFKDIIFTKLNDGEDVDMNIIQVVNDEFNIDIMQEFKLSKDLLTQE